MPVTPDKLDTIIGLLLDIKASVGKGTVAANTDEASKFLARWAPVTAVEFTAKYGVAPGGGATIPPMTAYDEHEAIYRARACYATYGKSCVTISNPAPAFEAIDVIAHATQDTASTFYETGYGLCHPDVAAYGFLTGIFKSKAEFAAGLGSGVQPRDYAGVTLEGMLAPNFSGGKPSGG